MGADRGTKDMFPCTRAKTMPTFQACLTAPGCLACLDSKVWLTLLPLLPCPRRGCWPNEMVDRNRWACSRARFSSSAGVAKTGMTGILLEGWRRFLVLADLLFGMLAMRIGWGRGRAKREGLLGATLMARAGRWRWSRAIFSKGREKCRDDGSKGSHFIKEILKSNRHSSPRSSSSSFNGT